MNYYQTKYNHKWNYLNDLDVNDATEQFEMDLLRFAKQAIPTKEIIVHRDDKPEIRKHSRIRDRLKSKAEKSNNPIH